MGLYRAFSEGCQLALGYPLIRGLHHFLDDETLGVTGLVSLVAADVMTSWADTTAFMYGGWYWLFMSCGEDDGVDGDEIVTIVVAVVVVMMMIVYCLFS